MDGYVAPALPAPIVTDSARLANVDAFIAATGAVVKHGGDRAYFTPGGDFIQMPPLESFTGSDTSSPVEAYYGTLAHELTHWSGAKSRLDREFGKRFGDSAYAFEELVAELGSAFLCADLDVCNEPRPDHAAYLNSWIEVLQRDKKAIFHAASKAEKACGYLHSLQDSTDPTEPPNEPTGLPVPVVVPVAFPMPVPVPMAPSAPVASPMAAYKPKPRNWRKRYSARPSLGKVPAWRSDADRAVSYYAWLAAQRGWTVAEARDYALAQPRCGLISAQHFSDAA